MSLSFASIRLEPRGREASRRGAGVRARVALGPWAMRLTVLLALLVAGPARGLTIQVPAQQADLNQAITSAANSADADNLILVTQSPFYWNSDILINNNKFNAGHRLLIRPGQGMSRAEIINQDPGNPLLTMSGVGGITMQDLDLLRDVTNLTDLVDLSTCTDVTIERCRLGYTNTSIGGSHLSMMVVNYPTHVVIRNCIFFSVMPAEFDRALWVLTMGDPSNSLFLYNNDFSDFGKVGVRSEGAGPDSALIVLRNNVVVNSAGISPEPVAYSSGAHSNMRVRSSYNTAFATAANAEAVDVGAQSLAGTSQAFLRLDPSAAEETGDFVTRTWDGTPGALNHDFDHLVDGAGLHQPSSYGITVLDGVPTSLDQAVTTDIDDQVRPSQGSLPHTDRGADQLDAETVSASAPRTQVRSGLWAAPLRNPSRSIELAFTSRQSGELVAEAFDAAGRVIWRERRPVAAGATGILESSRARAAGVIFYRIRLATPAGVRAETRGRMVLMR